MSSVPLISSILTRYEKGLPVSAEEKAMLHRWLDNAVKERYDWTLPFWRRARHAPFSKYEHIITGCEGEKELTCYCEKVSSKNAGMKENRKSIYSFRNFTSAFFRIFAACLPAKK